MTNFYLGVLSALLFFEAVRRAIFLNLVAEVGLRAPTELGVVKPFDNQTHTPLRLP